MIDIFKFEEEISKGTFSNCCIFVGRDEGIIQESISKVCSKLLNESFKDLNFIKFDGNKIDIEDVINACETLPFMDENKVVAVYRANFLKDKTDSENSKNFKRIAQYIGDVAPNTYLFMYYILESDRDKPSDKVKKLDRKVEVIKVDKLKGMQLQKKVKDLFKEKGKTIEKSELALFCTLVENDMNIINNEIEKICDYIDEGEITKDSIIDLMPQKSENDIFNLVDFLSQMKPEKSIDILNQLIFRGEAPNYILYMVERQIKLLLMLKLGMERRKSKDELSKELRLNPYICEKMMAQSKKFTLRQLEKGLDESLLIERKLKSKSVNSKMEIELLIVNIIKNK